jgi:hypothetical protein
MTDNNSENESTESTESTEAVDVELTDGALDGIAGGSSSSEAPAKYRLDAEGGNMNG